MAEIDWEMLDRYLAGECTPAERDRFEQWLAAHPAHERVVRALESAVGGDAQARDVAAHRAAVWARLEPELRPAPGAATPNSPDAPSRERSRRAAALGSRWPARPSRRLIAVRIAAALVLAIGGAVGGHLALAARAQRSLPVEMLTVSTTRGQRATFRLPDGTRVVLAAASTLRYPARARGAREVELEGEAYFEVVHDERRPFRVRAAGTVTEDLGTEFTVRAYANEPAVRVVVAAGLVSVRQAAAPPATARVLQPGDLARIAPHGAPAVRRVDPRTYLAWTTGRLAFEDAPLEEVLSHLERWFDADFSLADTTLAVRRFTGTFRADESLPDVLGVLAPALELEYERRGRAIVLLPAR